MRQVSPHVTEIQRNNSVINSGNQEMCSCACPKIQLYDIMLRTYKKKIYKENVSNMYNKIEHEYERIWKT